MANQKPIKNITASVKARLKQIAQSQSIDFNRILLLYMQEAFLRRLALSSVNKHFILKGGILFYGCFEEKARPTRDIDFLVRRTANTAADMRDIVEDISRHTAPDGVAFDAASIDVTEIKEQADYTGLRVKLIGHLGNIVLPLQIDIGFDDVIKPGAVVFEYPVLLDETGIKLYAYSWESVIAEKLEAIVQLNYVNSRFKDFYDIFFLSRMIKFDGQQLSKAIQATFQHRNTELKGYNRVFDRQFVQDSNRQQMWKSFLKKMHFDMLPELNDVLKEIDEFMAPVVQGLLQKETFKATWNPNDHVWR